MRQTQLILNPVENIPSLFDINPEYSVHGYYVSDKTKTDKIIQISKIGFSGRSEYGNRVHEIYEKWAKQLNVNYLSMRLLSGLHAHIILFMGLGNIGDTILLLPELAGGHFCSKALLERLGYRVIEMVINPQEMCIDIDKTKIIIDKIKPDLIFVDRSEGLYYEDFSRLIEDLPENCGAVFDSSQYLTNILMKDFPSPFAMGFDIMMSTMHKNFPGPQKALVCSQENNVYWQRIHEAVSSYVSNLHVENIFIAGNILDQENILKMYSKQMLINSIALEEALATHNVPVIQRDLSKIATHHVWILPPTKEQSFAFYKKLEQCEILVNYRLLPYHLGYGLRLGTSAATLQGINNANLSELAIIIAKIYHSTEISSSLEHEAKEFIQQLVPLTRNKL